MNDRIAKWRAFDEGGPLAHLWDRAKFMCAPFWWHNNNPQAVEILHNGTICFVDTGQRVIGVTAGHVYEQLEKDHEANPDFVCQFGADTVFPKAKYIDRSLRHDLVTFDLSEWAEPPTIYRAAEWPPPRVSPGQWVLYGGFPGKLRRLAQTESTFVFESISGDVEDVGACNILLHASSRRIEVSDGVRADKSAIDSAGISGGPVFLVDDTSEPKLRLVGFITELMDSDARVLARHADFIGPDGSFVQ